MSIENFQEGGNDPMTLKANGRLTETGSRFGPLIERETWTLDIRTLEPIHTSRKSFASKNLSIYLSMYLPIYLQYLSIDRSIDLQYLSIHLSTPLLTLHPEQLAGPMRLQLYM